MDDLNKKNNQINNQDEQIHQQLNEIQEQLKQIGIALQERPNDSEENENVQKKMNVLMQRIEENEKREKQREKRHNELTANLEALTSNFEEKTSQTEKRFKSIAMHYIERIDTDNQKQDFKDAVEQKFKGIVNGLNKLNSNIENKIKKTDEQVREYERSLNAKKDKNENLIESYNKTLKYLTHGMIAMFFVIIIIALVVCVTGPIGNFFGVSKLFDLTNHIIKAGESPWRYFMLLCYLVPYVCFGFIIFGILKAYNRVSWFR